jgi:hypothetical protein
MLDFSYLLARLISAIASWIDASNLRNKMYKLKEEKELLVVALEDLQRMDKGRKSGEYVKKVLEEIEKLKE